MVFAIPYGLILNKIRVKRGKNADNGHATNG